MKKSAFKIATLLSSLLLAFCLGGCGYSGEDGLPKLATPEVVIGSDGVATWGEVEHAMYYEYMLGSEEAAPTSACNVQLEDGDTVRVRAVSGDENFADSDYSAPQTYEKGNFVDLSIYAVNDLHGKFMDTLSQPGLDEFTTYMKGLYADTAREEILISSGDMWQGSVESSSTKGELMTKWMNEVGFSSMTLGNHEYDWGSAVLTPRSADADFPFLAINVRENGIMPAYCKASAVVEKGGVKVGIIGAIGDCRSSISGEFTKGLDFRTGSSLTALVKNEATRLRNDEGCDLIVYSIHDGSEDGSSGITSVKNSDMGWYDSALSNGYIDLVFEAHTHQSYILKDEYGVYHLQGGGENEGISRAEISFNTVTKDFTVSPSILSSAVYAAKSIEDDPFIAENYASYFPDQAEDPYVKVLGHNRSLRRSTEIVNKIAELYYQKGTEVWGDEYEIVLGGGYLKTRKPYELSLEDVHYADLYSILPFDNHIVLGRISGSKLKSNFINSKNSSYHIDSKIAAANVSDNEQYYIVVDTFTAYYSYNGITEIARIEGDLYARDLLAEFIEGGNWA